MNPIKCAFILFGIIGSISSNTLKSNITSDTFENKCFKDPVIDSINLKLIKLFPEKSKSAIFSIGNFSGHSLEIANFFKPRKGGDNQILNSFSLFLHEESQGGQVSIQFYENDMQKPGRLLGSVFIATVTTPNNWNQFDFSEHSIKVPKEGIFYSVKWVNSVDHFRQITIGNDHFSIDGVELGLVESSKKERFQLIKKDNQDWSIPHSISWRGFLLTGGTWSFMIKLD